ncbi:hypothetical protein HZ326_30015 [Fusarium oxysporum f. sp. albedinis]|nr:hypothetical protein HZ326_30015 [Fusarium oxysporum f. sp. albedinis]
MSDLVTGPCPPRTRNYRPTDHVGYGLTIACSSCARIIVNLLTVSPHYAGCMAETTFLHLKSWISLQVTSSVVSEKSAKGKVALSRQRSKGKLTRFLVVKNA